MITGVERDISQSDRERVRALAQKWWAAKAARRETKAIDQLPLSNLKTAPGAVDDALGPADLNAAEPPLEGVGAIERHHEGLRRRRDIDRRNRGRSSESCSAVPEETAKPIVDLLNRGVRSPGSRRERLRAKRSRREMAPQPLEKIGSAPGNGMAS